jgi:hypothetical protein
MPSSANVLRTVRQAHLYFGVFIAPALLFFAFTGFVQTFSLHETTRGSSYKPPRFLVELGQLHKKQTIVVPERKPQPPTPVAAKAVPAPAPVAPAPPQAKARNLWPMKIFFAVVTLGLASSTLTGLYMAYKFGRKPALITGLWVAGIVIPLALLLF